MDTENESVLVKLTRMEGKLDLSNMRHDQHDERFRTIDQRLHTHGNRIQLLEASNHKKEGERAGLALSGKAIWIAAGLVPTALVAAILRAMGA